MTYTPKTTLAHDNWPVREAPPDPSLPRAPYTPKRNYNSTPVRVRADGGHWKQYKDVVTATAAIGCTYNVLARRLRGKITKPLTHSGGVYEVEWGVPCV